jgi:restriction system protein
MKIVFVFLSPYLGLFLGSFAHSVGIGVLGASFSLLLPLLVSARARRSRRRGNPHASMTTIDAMSGVQFEDYIAARLRRTGWHVRVTPMVGDYGVDLIADRDGKSVAIQCKRHNKPVGVAAVQQVVSGALYHGCTKSIVVSNQEFTTAARQLAYTHGCQLIGRKVLQAWVPPPKRAW